MANRGDIVTYTYASTFDVTDENGNTTSAIGYKSRPAVVLESRGANALEALDLHVFGESWEFTAQPGAFPNGDSVVLGVAKGPAPPDTKKGSNANPTAMPGQVGTWSP